MAGRPVLLASHAVVQAIGKDYGRRSQERLLVQPLLERLVAACGDEKGAERRLVEVLDGWRGRPRAEQGYGPGNVVNLLRLLRGDLRGLDFSRLAVRQAYLQGVEAQDASLAGAHLAEVVLGEAFAYLTAVGLSADGAFLAAGTPTGEVRLWRTADRTPLLTVQGHTGAVWSVALSGDGRLLASGSADGTVRLWDATDPPAVGAPSGENPENPTGVLLRTPGHSVGAPVLPRAPGQPLAILQAHAGGVWDVALSGDGRLLASGGADGTVRLWDVDPQAGAPGRLLATLQGHTGAVWNVAFSGDGRRLASGGEDGTVRLWAAPSGQPLAALQAHTGPVWCVAFSWDGRLLASSGDDGTVRLWEARDPPGVGTPSGETHEPREPHRGSAAHSGPLRGSPGSAAHSGPLRGARSADSAAYFEVLRPAPGQPLATLQGHTGAVWGVALAGDGRLLASGGADGTVRLWDVDPQAGAPGRLLAMLQGHTGAVWDVVLSDDGRLLASGGADGTVRLWEARDPPGVGTPSGEPQDPLPPLRGARSTSSAAHSEVLPRTPGRPLATLQGHTDTVQGVALPGDGRLLASG
jgi:WD40 repeat protein